MHKISDKTSGNFTIRISILVLSKRFEISKDIQEEKKWLRSLHGVSFQQSF